MHSLWMNKVLAAIFTAVGGVIDCVSATEQCITGGTPFIPVVKYCDHGCCGERYNGHCCPKSHAAGIVGGVFGGVMLVSLVIAALLWYHERQKHARSVEPEGMESAIAKHGQTDYATTSLWYPTGHTTHLEPKESQLARLTEHRTCDSVAATNLSRFPSAAATPLEGQESPIQTTPVDQETSDSSDSVMAHSPFNQPTASLPVESQYSPTQTPVGQDPSNITIERPPLYPVVPVLPLECREGRIATTEKRETSNGTVTRSSNQVGSIMSVEPRTIKENSDGTMTRSSNTVGTILSAEPRESHEISDGTLTGSPNSVRSILSVEPRKIQETSDGTMTRSPNTVGSIMSAGPRKSQETSDGSLTQSPNEVGSILWTEPRESKETNDGTLTGSPNSVRLELSAEPRESQETSDDTLI